MMPQITGLVNKGSGVEVEDVMVRFGWLRENGPGATLMVRSRRAGSKAPSGQFGGGLKDPVKVKSNLLWGKCSPMDEVSLKSVDLKVCEFRNKAGSAEAVNMSRWVDSLHCQGESERQEETRQGPGRPG